MPAGRTLSAGKQNPEAVSNARVVLRHNSQSPLGYNVHTAYPIP